MRREEYEDQEEKTRLVARPSSASERGRGLNSYISGHHRYEENPDPIGTSEFARWANSNPFL